MVNCSPLLPCQAPFINRGFKTRRLVFATDGKIRTMQNDV
ncbi:hypothetical protein HMPREF9554_01367 [Treponema phagedenis F0421]|nr:hypothetical protein HMPREF9554_01367 [Treponema phagedenis F0421]